MISYWISRIDFLDGTSETFSKGGIMVIVGPNNAGKSVLLREIYEAVQGQPSNIPRRWVQNVMTTHEGGDEEFRAWFKTFARIVPPNRPGEGDYGFWEDPGPVIPIADAMHQWSTNRDMGLLKRKLIGYYPAMMRDSLIGGPGQRNVTTPAAHPMFELWDNIEVEEKLSGITQRAFGFPISINRYSQSSTLLRGKTGMPDEPLPPSQELLEAYGKLLPLSEQGDGIKSFTGLALHAISARILVTVIDEPEVFLHPPQAKLIGRLLASEAPQNGQVFIATHSSDVLEGMLDGRGNREVKIVRVNNTGNADRRSRSILEPDRVSQLWKDPLLRYSRLLDGLFHGGVVICEADSDCRFYTATLDTLLSGQKEHDLLFTHVGGKGRLARAAAEMTRFNVPIAIIGDLDVLRQKGQIEALISALNGDPDEYSVYLELIRNDVASRNSAPLASSLKAAFSPFMKMADNRRIGEQDIKDVTEAIRLRSGWKEVKRAGISCFEGTVYQAVSGVVDKLTEIGLFLVPVGELERWYPGVSAGHGPAFVSTLLEGGHHNTLSSDLNSFLEKLARHFHLL